MRGHDEQQKSMYSYISPEKRVPSDHPLRRRRGMVDAALKEMSHRSLPSCTRATGGRRSRRNVMRATVLVCAITGVLASAEVYMGQLV